MDRTDFVSLKEMVPETLLDMRYASTNNFTGTLIPGYHAEMALFPKVLLAHFEKASAIALKKGYRLKIFDAYRPQKAVDYFLAWSQAPETSPELKELYYPRFDRSELFNEGYLSLHSSHSLGIALDLTLVEASTYNELDMGGHFDLFDEISNTHSSSITKAQMASREELINLMEEAGFRNYSKEWWHYSIRPVSWDQYLNFDIA